MRRFGIEIEAVGMSCRQVSALLNRNGIECVSDGYNHHTLTTWKIVTDSSLNGSDAFEVVSPPLQGEEGIEEVRKVVELLNETGCDVNRSCGLHVHVEVRDLSPAHLANLFNRYRTFEEEIDRFMPRSRRASNNTYCKSLRNGQPLVARTTNELTVRAMTDRYHKVNLTSFVRYGTIEFRQHSGSLNRAKVANWIRFLIQFVEESSPEPTRVVETAATPNTNLRGKTRAIVDMLADGGSYSADQICERIGSSRRSMYSLVASLRQRGYHITTGRRYQMLAGATSTGTVQEVVSSDSLFKGIDTAIKSYYTRRAATIAA